MFENPAKSNMDQRCEYLNFGLQAVLYALQRLMFDFLHDPLGAFAWLCPDALRHSETNACIDIHGQTICKAKMRMLNVWITMQTAAVCRGLSDIIQRMAAHVPHTKQLVAGLSKDLYPTWERVSSVLLAVWQVRA